MIKLYALEDSYANAYLLENGSGVLLLELIPQCCNLLQGGSATGTDVLTIGEQEGEGLVLKVFDKTIDLYTTPASKWSLDFVLPEGCVLVNSQFHLLDNITGASGAIAISLGKDDPGTEGEGGETINLTANQQGKTPPGFWLDELDTDSVSLTRKLFATNGSGTPTGLIGGGAPGTERVRVRMIYLVTKDLL